MKTSASSLYRDAYLSVIRRTGILFFAALSPLLHGQAVPCIEFEGFPAGATFSQGQVISEAGFPMTIGTYTDGSEVFFQSAFIVGFSPHQGQSLGFSVASVLIDVGCVEEVSVQVANAAAGINVGVNGQLEVLRGADETLDIGGVTVIISSSGGGNGQIRFISNPTAISSILLGGEEFFIDHVCTLPCGGNSTCLDFENLGEQIFAAGDSFEENGREVHISSFGGSGGTASASDRNVAGHLGDELHLEGATARIEFGCASGLSMRVAQSENGVFLAINGSSATTNDLSSFDGQSLGGVVIAISNGEMTLFGEIGTLEIGGTSLFLDHICVIPCFAGCIDFETQTGGAEFFNRDIIMEDGIAITVESFQGEPVVVIEDREQRAGHLGKDAALFDAVLNVGIPCSSEVSLHFGQYQDGAMLNINGDRTIVQNMTDLDGMEIGGALVEVVANQLHGSSIGTLRVTGPNISEFAIGGTELVVDHICHVPCPNPGCVDFEVFPLGQTFAPGDVFFEESTRMTVSTHGDVTMPGSVTIGNDNLAGGGGKEAVLNRARLRFDFLCAQRVEFSYARPPGGLAGVILGVNGATLQLNNFTAYDQDTLGGAGIEVIGTPEAGRVIITRSFNFGPGISSVLVGGNAVVLDNICHTECVGVTTCANFTILPLGATYSADDFDIFENGNLSFLTAPYQGSDGLARTGGEVTVSSEGKAGFSDRELRLRDATVSIQGQCMTGVSFRFGQYGGEIRLGINNAVAHTTSLATLHGTTLGGVGITVNTLPAPGGEFGYIIFNGQINGLDIGGEDFYLDRLCYTPCPVPLELGRAFLVSDTPINATQRQVVVEVEFSGTGSLILQRSTDLTPGSWVTQNATMTTPAGRPNIRRFTFTIPASTERIFFRGRATP
jgi:hypothetical protein